MDLADNTKMNVEGHIKIIDPDTGDIIVDKRNAINYINFSLMNVRSLANQKTGLYGIHKMAFGNDGVSVDPFGEITYKTPKTNGTLGSLYNQTYEKNIQNDPNSDSDNNIQYYHTTGNNFSDIVVTATLNYDEPQGQPTDDQTSSITNDFIFNEIALKTEDDLYLTHVIFHPVLKSSNRKIKIIYTIRITIGE